MTKNEYLSALCALAGAGLVTAVSATAAETQRQLGAHEHGVTTLNIALEGKTVYAELEGPALNFVGFEYQPRTTAEKEAVAATLNVLREGEQVIEFLPAGACEPDSAAAQHIVEAEEAGHDDEGHADEDHADSGHDDKEHEEHNADSASAAQHAEFTAEYTFSCAQPDKLEAVRVLLFARFELTEEVETSFIGPGAQVFQELTATGNTLSIER